MKEIFEGIKFFNIPMTTTVMIVVGIFLAIQIIGEILEFKGKVVPEFIKIRKYFIRKKQERIILRQMPEVIANVQGLLDEIKVHYSEENLAKRDSWMQWVNDRAEVYDSSIEILKEEIKQNTIITRDIQIELKRNEIINFASKVVDANQTVTREQFKRVYKIYNEYEKILEDNNLTNGEVDIAKRIIDEAYRDHIKAHTFLEDVRGYK